MGTGQGLSNTSDRLSAHDLFRALLDSQKEVRVSNEKIADAMSANTAALSALKVAVDNSRGTLFKALIGLIIFLVVALAAMVGVKLATPGVSVETESTAPAALLSDAAAIAVRD